MFPQFDFKIFLDKKDFNVVNYIIYMWLFYS